ncbi:hybrid sensor histidine kinase/response regulator [Pseudoduganella armeniaca]|uniref:histidine kinase n=1 Tax=Pseudoduganella armeniaca TaxID=2072590 RepID=A0A2R4CAI6_9BURK|nr:response regulator [Pseudoduganella armeniaca]AVR96611.1 hybrid sensor histidine kinase/response regulator [Pseudoduganella armeniaca]
MSGAAPVILLLGATAEPAQLPALPPGALVVACDTATVQGEAADWLPPATALCVIAASVARPVPLARHVRRHWPSGRIVFLAEDTGALRAELRRSPMIGDAVVLDPNDPQLGRQLAQALQAAATQRRLRTTLERANTQLASRPVDSTALRRMVIAESYLRDFWEQSADAVIGLDANTQVVYWNRRASELLDIAPADATGTYAHELPFWNRELDAALARMSEGASRSVLALRIRGNVEPTEVAVTGIRDGDTIVGVLLSLRPASGVQRELLAERERSRAAVALAQDKARQLASLFEHAPGIMAVTAGAELVFEMANESFGRLFGTRPAPGATLDDTFPWLAGQPLRDLYELARISGEEVVATAVPLSRPGAAGEVHLNLVLKPVREEDGAGHIFLQADDVTAQATADAMRRRHQEELEEAVAQRTRELEAAQAALLQAQKMEAIGKLTGGIAHDFNNILQVVGSNLELLAAEHSGDASARQRIASAVAAVDRGARLSGHLLAFARRQPLQPTALDPGDVVRGMEELLRRAIGEAVAVEICLPPGLWAVQLDRGQLENVLLNLAINARDAMAGSGSLTIELDNVTLDARYSEQHGDVGSGDYVLLAVSDTGAGMTPETRARAFEPFFTTKPEGQGTGLGLSMVYGFIKQSGGHVELYSEVGHGTTVKLYLPRTALPAQPATPAARGPLRGGTETILVVEDDADVRAAAADQLAALGYDVLTAASAHAAWRLLQDGARPDLLFTDVVMPGPLSSPELARKASAMLPGLAVLFTSGYTQNAIVHGGRLDAGVELLSKPYRRDELAGRVRAVLDSRAGGAAAPLPARARVLVVEDNPDALDLLCQMVELVGYAATGAGSAEAALALLAQADILLTDVQLPGMSGLALAQQAHSAHPAMRIVFATGAQAPVLPFATAALRKPYTIEQLRQALAAT